MSFIGPYPVGPTGDGGQHLQITQDEQNGLGDLFKDNLAVYVRTAAGGVSVNKGGLEERFKGATRVKVNPTVVNCEGELDRGILAVRAALDIGKSLEPIKNLGGVAPDIRVRGSDGIPRFYKFTKTDTGVIIREREGTDVSGIFIPDVISTENPIVFDGDQNVIQAMLKYRGIQLARENPVIESAAPALRGLANDTHTFVDGTEYVLNETGYATFIQPLDDWLNSRQSGIAIPHETGPEHPIFYDGDEKALKAMLKYRGIQLARENPVIETAAPALRELASDTRTLVNGTEYVLNKTKYTTFIQPLDDWLNSRQSGIAIPHEIGPKYPIFYDGDEGALRAMEAFLSPDSVVAGAPVDASAGAGSASAPLHGEIVDGLQLQATEDCRGLTRHLPAVSLTPASVLKALQAVFPFSMEKGFLEVERRADGAIILKETEAGRKQKYGVYGGYDKPDFNVEGDQSAAQIMDWLGKKEGDPIDLADLNKIRSQSRYLLADEKDRTDANKQMYGKLFHLLPPDGSQRKISFLKGFAGEELFMSRHDGKLRIEFKRETDPHSQNYIDIAEDGTAVFSDEHSSFKGILPQGIQENVLKRSWRTFNSIEEAQAVKEELNAAGVTGHWRIIAEENKGLFSNLTAEDIPKKQKDYPGGTVGGSPPDKFTYAPAPKFMLNGTGATLEKLFTGPAQMDLLLHHLDGISAFLQEPQDFTSGIFEGVLGMMASLESKLPQGGAASSTAVAAAGGGGVSQTGVRMHNPAIQSEDSTYVLSTEMTPEGLVMESKKHAGGGGRGGSHSSAERVVRFVKKGDEILCRINKVDSSDIFGGSATYNEYSIKQDREGRFKISPKSSGTAYKSEPFFLYTESGGWQQIGSDKWEAAPPQKITEEKLLEDLEFILQSSITCFALYSSPHTRRLDGPYIRDLEGNKLPYSALESASRVGQNCPGQSALHMYRPTLVGDALHCHSPSSFASAPYSTSSPYGPNGYIESWNYVENMLTPSTYLPAITE
jgi:hypothetical protein